jgi:putative ABC transport system permease protein
MLVSGTSPVYAGIFQFVIVAMILAASGIAGLVATVLMRRQAFSAAAQLKIRPGIPAAAGIASVGDGAPRHHALSAVA